METIIGAAPQPAGTTAAEDLIKDTDTANFAKDVIDASRDVPIIVDFWAPWCGPCKQLGPLLEKSVKAARGAVRLVKINIDENQALAAQLRIQSVPAVYAFFQGQPIDGFVGALPESQIKSFIDRLAEAAGTGAQGSASEEALEQAEKALQEGQVGAASALFGQVLSLEPENAKAIAGIIRCHLQSNDVEVARQMYDGLTDDYKEKPEFQSIVASLELAEASQAAGDLGDLMATLANNPNDHQARFDLAMGHYAAGKREEAVDELLELMRRDRGWNEEAARKQLLKFFEAWGHTDPLTQAARRRLSSLLFS